MLEGTHACTWRSQTFEPFRDSAILTRDAGLRNHELYRTRVENQDCNSTIALSWSPAPEVCACTTRKSISAYLLRDRPSGSRKWTTASRKPRPPAVRHHHSQLKFRVDDLPHLEASVCFRCAAPDNDARMPRASPSCGITLTKGPLPAPSRGQRPRQRSRVVRHQPTERRSYESGERRIGCARMRGVGIAAELRLRANDKF